MQWETEARKKYEMMLTKIPVFHREITKKVVDVKAPMNAQDRGADEVSENDIVSAFHSEVPKAFYSLMIRIMDDVGFDHSQYK